MTHVIDYQTIPEDIRGIFEIVAPAGAVAVRATADGHWALRVQGGNPITIEGAIRAAGQSAFAGSPTMVTLRAITAGEVGLFDDDDAAVLRGVIDRAAERDSQSVVQRAIGAIREADNAQR